MKLNRCSICLLDFLYSNNKEQFIQELNELDNSFVSDKDMWNDISVSKWKRKEFTLSTIPPELSFCKEFKIILIQYKNISSAIMLTIEVEIHPSLLGTIEAQDYKENFDTLEKYQKELWAFWTEKFTSIVLIKNKPVNFNILAINHLKFDEDNYQQFLHQVWSSIKERQDENQLDEFLGKENYVSKFASKYGVNDLELISALNITNQSLSLLGQSRAVYGYTGLDFTGLLLLDVKNTKWESDVSLSFVKILSFQHFIHWLVIQKEDITTWHDRLQNLSVAIKKFGSGSRLGNKEIDMKLFDQKALFQTEYAVFMTEHREISKSAQRQLSLTYEDSEGELIVETEFYHINSPPVGILQTLRRNS